MNMHIRRFHVPFRFVGGGSGHNPGFTYHPDDPDSQPRRSTADVGGLLQGVLSVVGACYCHNLI